MLACNGQMLLWPEVGISTEPQRRIYVQSKHVVLGACCLLIVTGLLPARAQSGWRVEKTFHIGGDGGWDYVTADPSTIGSL